MLKVGLHLPVIIYSVAGMGVLALRVVLKGAGIRWLLKLLISQGRRCVKKGR